MKNSKDNSVSIWFNNAGIVYTKGYRVEFETDSTSHSMYLADREKYLEAQSQFAEKYKLDSAVGCVGDNLSRQVAREIWRELQEWGFRVS